MHDREIAKALTEKQIEVLESLLALVPTVKEVARRFDGKVLNKRFDTALDNATNGKASCKKKTYMDGYEIELHEYSDRYISVHIGLILLKGGQTFLSAAALRRLQRAVDAEKSKGVNRMQKLKAVMFWVAFTILLASGYIPLR